MRLAEELGYSLDECAAVYYTAMLKDAGCTCWTSTLAEIWQTDEIAARRDLFLFGDDTLPAFVSFLLGNVGKGLPPLKRGRAIVSAFSRTTPVFHEGMFGLCEVSARIAGRLGMPTAVREALVKLFEYWNGQGEPNRLAGEEIPRASRCVLPAFLFTPFHRVRGRDAAVEAVRDEGGRIFEPAVCDALGRLAGDTGFWEVLEGPDILATVLAMEPDTETSFCGDALLDAMAEALADFVDLKSPATAAHSRRVAAIHR
jgi:hypothetical protein